MLPRAGKSTQPSNQLTYLSTFAPYLSSWDLVPDGEPIVTERSHLLPVLHRGNPAMLKIAVEPEERLGAGLMTWWDGEGAARVYAQDGDALLLERAESKCSLAKMARGGKDDEASRILCAVAARLHTPRGHAPSDLIPLERRFAELAPAAASQGGILRTAPGNGVRVAGRAARDRRAAWRPGSSARKMTPRLSSLWRRSP
jgi:streptomycin 6-kinase